nr:hypothetical protein [Tanacetum cinerariifolium]
MFLGLARCRVSRQFFPLFDGEDDRILETGRVGKRMFPQSFEKGFWRSFTLIEKDASSSKRFLSTMAKDSFLCWR